VVADGAAAAEEAFARAETEASGSVRARTWALVEHALAARQSGEPSAAARCLEAAAAAAAAAGEVGEGCAEALTAVQLFRAELAAAQGDMPTARARLAEARAATTAGGAGGAVGESLMAVNTAAALVIMQGVMGAGEDKLAKTLTKTVARLDGLQPATRLAEQVRVVARGVSWRAPAAPARAPRWCLRFDSGAGEGRGGQEQLLSRLGAPGVPAPKAKAGAVEEQAAEVEEVVEAVAWTCEVCTYINEDPLLHMCEMCGVPKA
jgi:hypothetical protein